MNTTLSRSIARLALLLAANPAHAALTITVSPGAEGGTLFNVTQDSPNPIIALDAVTLGFIAGIPLSGASIAQNPELVAFTGSFEESIGTLTELNGAGSSDVVAFRLSFDSVYRPALVLEDPIEFGPRGSRQFAYSGEGVSGVSLDFGNFMPGTHVEASPMFGQITTIVVPEPSVCLMVLIPALTGLAFGRTRSRVPPAGMCV